MITAILLAAGQSKRMGNKNKLAKKIKGIPLIKRSANNITSSSIDELIVVLGYQKKIIKKLIGRRKKIKFVFNKNFKTGMSSSIKIGVKNLSIKTDFFFICLGDMPLVNKNIYNLLIKSRNKKKIIVPVYRGMQGNPVLFSKFMIKKIMNIKGDIGAKKILKSNKDKILNLKVNHYGVTRGFDTKENFKKIF
tara:strand:+ start:118 stop:693 length:576 start_codon:yes stop_codon:yes gene_type:complete